MSSSAIRRSRRRLAKWTAVAAVLVGVLVSAGVVWNASYSAFSAQTTTPAENWTAGTVSLTNGQTGSALFNLTGLKPGYTDYRCITVTSSGNLPSVVKMYTTPGSYSAGQSLGNHMILYVTQGSGTAVGTDCAGFTLDNPSYVFTGQLQALAGNYKSFSSGLGSWTTTGGASETKVYRFQLQLQSFDSDQGATASIGLTWEAQNT